MPLSARRSRLLGPQPLAFLVVLLLALLLYGPVLHGFFILDDFVWLECARQTLHDPGNVFNLQISGFFRPLSHLVFAGVYAVSPTPAAFHLAVWLLHALCAALLAQLVLLLSRDRWLAFFAALLFGLNMLYAEVMVWVSALNEPLAGAMALATLIAWLHHLRRGGWGSYLLALAFLALALGTKESTVSLLPLMGLLHLWLGHRGELREGPRVAWFRAGLRYLPPVLLLAAYLAMQLGFQRQNLLVQGGRYAPGLHAVPRLALNLWQLVRFIWPPLVAAALCALMQRRGRWGLRRAPAGALHLALQRSSPAPGASLWLPALLLSAAALLMLPYCMFHGGVMASRYFYGPALVGGIAAALGLRLCATLPAAAARIMALLALSGVAIHAAVVSASHTRRYRDIADEVQTFVLAVAKVPPTDAPAPVLDSVLGGQHLQAALRLYHPSHRVVLRAERRGVNQCQPGPLWRWDREVRELRRLR